MPLMKKKDGSLQHVSVEDAERMVKDKEAVRAGTKPKKTKEIEEAPANKMVEKAEKKKSK